MHRDVDFARLRGLPGRRVVNAAVGEHILRQGDPPGELYLVVSGHIRLERGGAALAEVGPSELFGEVALYSGGSQPYDAVATAATTMLAIPSESAQAALGQAGKFALGLAQTLADRAGQLAGPVSGSPAAPARAPAAPTPPLAAAFGPMPPVPPPAETPSAPSPAAEPGSLLGGLLPPWEAAKKAEAEKPAIDKSIPRPEAFWQKAMRCPVCSKPFQLNQPRDTFVELASRDADLYEHHRGINPMYYGIPVCPECYYAAYPDDFNKLLSTEVQAVDAALRDVRLRVGHIDFKGYRDAAQARAAFELGIICYGARRPQYRKVAGLYHRLAWLSRAAGNAESEKAYLTTARAGYQSALDNNQVEDARTELLLTYLAGELSRRIGDTAEATRWASLVLGHPQIGAHKMVNDLAQQLRSELRAAARSPS